METLKTITYKGEEIEIWYVSDYDFTDWINESEAFIVYNHRDFTVKRKGFDPKDIFEAYREGKKLYDGHWIMPLYAYIHSGVSLSLSRAYDPWDTSFKGFVLVKRIKGWSYTREKAFSIAKSVVEEWNHCLGGEIYGYSTISDSCGGFIGPEGLEQAIEEAKHSIDAHIAKKRKQHFNQLKIWIKNRVPYYVRKELQFI